MNSHRRRMPTDKVAIVSFDAASKQVFCGSMQPCRKIE